MTPDVRWLAPWAMAPLHGLSWLPVRDPSNLYAPAYTRWCREALPPAAWEPFAEDAQTLAALYQRALPASRALHAFSSLHRTREDLVAVLREPARAMVSSPRLTPWGASVYATLDEALLEVFRADLALTLAAFERAVEPLCEPSLVDAVRAEIVSVREVLPGACCDARLAIPLGLHGRVLDGSVLVGCPGVWGDASPSQIAQQWLHECAVHEASRTRPPSGHEAIEGLAVAAVDHAVRGTALEGPRALWRARHDLTGLSAVSSSVEALSARLRGGPGP